MTRSFRVGPFHVAPRKTNKPASLRQRDEGRIAVPSHSSPIGGKWSYVRDSIRLEASWRDHECGSDLSFAIGNRVEHRYFDGMDALFLYHQLLERALLRAGWMPVGYVSESRESESKEDDSRPWSAIRQCGARGPQTA